MYSPGGGPKKILHSSKAAKQQSSKAGHRQSRAPAKQGTGKAGHRQSRAPDPGKIAKQQSRTKVRPARCTPPPQKRALLWSPSLYTPNIFSTFYPMSH